MAYIGFHKHRNDALIPQEKAGLVDPSTYKTNKLG